MTSSVISFAYFTDFSNECRYLQTVNGVFIFFYGILCDTPKISRGKGHESILCLTSKTDLYCRKSL